MQAVNNYLCKYFWDRLLRERAHIITSEALNTSIFLFQRQTRKSSSSSSNYPVVNPPYPAHAGYPPNDPYPPATANNNPYPGAVPKAYSLQGNPYPMHNSPPYPPNNGHYPTPNPLYPTSTGNGLRYPVGRFAGGIPASSNGGSYPVHSPPGSGLARGGLVQQPYPAVYPAVSPGGGGGLEDWGRSRGSGWQQQQQPQPSASNYHEEVQFPPLVSSSNGFFSFSKYNTPPSCDSALLLGTEVIERVDVQADQLQPGSRRTAGQGRPAAAGRGRFANRVNRSVFSLFSV